MSLKTVRKLNAIHTRNTRVQQQVGRFAGLWEQGLRV